MDLPEFSVKPNNGNKQSVDFMNRTINNRKIIVGLDLSLISPAIAVITIENGITTLEKTYYFKQKQSGANKCMGSRLTKIAELVQAVATDYPTIDAIGIEKGFILHNNTSALLNQVRGVAEMLLYCYYPTIRVNDLTPAAVKKIVQGHGTASKQEVADAVLLYFRGEQRNYKFFNDDESDATAVAIAVAKKYVSYLVQQQKEES